MLLQREKFNCEVIKMDHLMPKEFSLLMRLNERGAGVSPAYPIELLKLAKVPNALLVGLVTKFI
jgi:hypothetical protein